MNYLNPGSRGLEAGDSVTISGTNQIPVDVTASSPGDYVRVITAETSATTTMPEPGLLATGLVALVLAALRGRRLPSCAR